MRKQSVVSVWSGLACIGVAVALAGCDQRVPNPRGPIDAAENVADQVEARQQEAIDQFEDRRDGR
ncbi:MAG: hypothetical protein AAF747_04740 [Planctomycetota bacterium]